jgi:hypothetical protein
VKASGRARGESAAEADRFLDRVQRLLKPADIAEHGGEVVVRQG